MSPANWARNIAGPWMVFMVIGEFCSPKYSPANLHQSEDECRREHPHRRLEHLARSFSAPIERGRSRLHTPALCECAGWARLVSTNLRPRNRFEGVLHARQPARTHVFSCSYLVQFARRRHLLLQRAPRVRQRLRQRSRPIQAEAEDRGRARRRRRARTGAHRSAAVV